ncbi:MAG: STAS domain-containing protein [Gemmatimonadota bacterium]
MNNPVGAPLEIAVRKDTGAHVVEIAGDFVISSREAVGRAIEDLLDSGGYSVVVDGTRLSHIDTPSLALLTRLSARCREAGGDLVLTGLPARFAALVKALRLDEALTFEETVGRALERLGA